MTESAAEQYLRLAGERALLDPPGDDGPAESSPLEAAGHALVTVGAITAGAAQALASDGDGVAAELPFGWISDVWARGLGTCWDRFCLAAGPAGAGWEVSAVGPGLGAPEPIMLSGPAGG